ncbi:hypothetical protein BU17DRAFT_68080 [Hysterangium stoloniferum]|nr:hypothetical protein BU17DRAFT_68080 [Hysterangium stoloniferum]
MSAPMLRLCVWEINPTPSSGIPAALPLHLHLSSRPPQTAFLPVGQDHHDPAPAMQSWKAGRNFPCQWRNSQRGRNQWVDPALLQVRLGNLSPSFSVHVIATNLQNQNQEHAERDRDELSDEYEQGARAVFAHATKVLQGHGSQDICPKKGEYAAVALMGSVTSTGVT